MKSILIVGVGNIGSKLYKKYKALSPDRYDPYKGFFEKRDIVYDFAFIAVDTPMNDDGSCNIEAVINAIEETQSNIYILCSTVPPTTTQKLQKMFSKRIVFMPEFFGTTQHSDEDKFDFNFVILGGDKKDCNEVIQLLQDVYDARVKFNITDSTTAELSKYFENCMLATKVSLCVQFWQLAQKYGVSYPELRELVLNDTRINRAHTFVYDEHPYWESHCFDKDLNAISNEAPLIKSIIDFNEFCKQSNEVKYAYK